MGRVTSRSNNAAASARMKLGRLVRCCVLCVSANFRLNPLLAAVGVSIATVVAMAFVGMYGGASWRPVCGCSSLLNPTMAVAANGASGRQ